MDTSLVSAIVASAFGLAAPEAETSLTFPPTPKGLGRVILVLPGPGPA